MQKSAEKLLRKHALLYNYNASEINEDFIHVTL